ncbi:MAG: AtpZ/AtpI family protein [Armatimonadetes bacterium]|nr:AtpZ/AtpI family protein [Armatimonadota bacterium]
MLPSGRSQLEAARYLILAWSIPLSIAIGYGFGWWLDGRFGTTPWLQVAGFILGAASGLAQLLQLAGRRDDGD